MMNTNTNDKSAFIAIVGRPNVGKSSILNRLLGQKIAIVSSKPQTTRNRITGVLTEGENQLVFFDTPGMHKPKNSLGKYMVRSVNESVGGVDCCMLVVEAGREAGQTELDLIEKFKMMDMPAILAINKIDMLKEKDALMKQILAYSNLYNFEAVVPVSAQDGNGMGELLDELKNQATEGGHFFDDDTLTDQPERVIVAEIIREKILRLCDKEIPHGTAVVIEKMKTRDNGILDIDATIFCERDTHKRIIIGKNGSMLKKISTFARQDIEKFFDCKVFLQTWIKVKEDWRNRAQILQNFGYDEKNFD
ncbi:MAG TPA: GTPase Era [Ruminococcus sp.]|nr:GTPase Era [Ruminococcus sp.]